MLHVRALCGQKNGAAVGAPFKFGSMIEVGCGSIRMMRTAPNLRHRATSACVSTAAPCATGRGYMTFQTGSLLERRQIFIFSASFIRSSRKFGCEMLIIFSARIHVGHAVSFTAPYSVTM